ncbi:MAG: hypothetical protein LBS92_01905 [Candidatus Methanoplasma sp.]|nr:hypothetical protein [Candidatus Methanoplasma sp.]
MATPKHGTSAKSCDVAGCEKEAERSISLKQVSKSSLTMKNPDARSAHLCKDHYKTFKKDTKNDRGLDKVY